MDYVFTDPPFGSNLFYSDMNLFQEAWLERVTDPSDEAVVDRRRSKARRDADRYEGLLTDALREAHRVLVADGWVSLNLERERCPLGARTAEHCQRGVRARPYTDQRPRQGSAIREGPRVWLRERRYR